MLISYTVAIHLADSRPYKFIPINPLEINGFALIPSFIPAQKNLNLACSLVVNNDATFKITWNVYISSVS